MFGPNRRNKSLIELLKARPGEILITPKGDRLYALSADTQGNDVLISINADAKNFNEMTPDEVNQFIINKLNP